MIKINIPQITKKVDAAVIKHYGQTDNVTLYSLFFDKKLELCLNNKMRRPGVNFLINCSEYHSCLKDSSYIFLENRFRRYNNEYLLSLLNKSKTNPDAEIKVFDGEEPTLGSFSNFVYLDMATQFTVIDFVAAGYTNVINPNLISSLGYRFEY